MWRRSWRAVLSTMGVGALFLAAAGWASAAAPGGRCNSELLAVRGGGWRAVAPGLEMQDLRIEFGDTGIARLTTVRVDPARFRVRLSWLYGEGSFKAATASEASRRSGATVVVNAGFFGVDGRPLGYFLSEGKVYNRRVLFRGRRAALHLGALFFVREGSEEWGIASRESFDARGVREAFQAGPYLVRGGRWEPGLESYREFHRPARRSILALDRKGRLLVGVNEGQGRGLSWCELQAVLTRGGDAGELDVVEAMNLDGGSSSQLYVRAGNFTRHLAGRPVPAFILLLPRSSGSGIRRN